MCFKSLTFGDVYRNICKLNDTHKLNELTGDTEIIPQLKQ